MTLDEAKELKLGDKVYIKALSSKVFNGVIAKTLYHDNHDYPTIDVYFSTPDKVIPVIALERMYHGEWGENITYGL